MPRKARWFTPGVVYHLIPRFVENRWFMKGATERESYLSLLGRAVTDSDWSLISYGLMSSHTHLELIAGEQPLEDWLRRVHAPFADMINRTNERIGPVFVRGPAAHPTPMDRVGDLLAYIHNNPVRASVVSDAVQSTWTSHRAYLGLEEAPPWLDVEAGMKLSRFAGPEALAQFVGLAPDDPSRDSVDRLKREATSTPQEFRAARLEAQADIDASTLVEVVARELAISVASLRCPARQQQQVVARRVVARCARSLGVTGKAVAKVLGITQQAVSASLHRPERDDEDVVVTRVCEQLRR